MKSEEGAKIKKMKKYNAIVFTAKVKETRFGNGFLKFHNISTLNNFLNYLDRNYPEWKYINLYCAETRDKVCVLTQNNRHPP